MNEQTAVVKATVKSMGDFLEKYKPQIASLLPKHLDAEKMLRISQVALSRNPKLVECTPISILDCVIKASQLGLELNGPLHHSCMVPFWNGQNKTLEAQFQLEYRGLIELARRTGEMSYVDAHPIYASDFFQYEYGTKQELVHRPGLTHSDDLIGAYALIKFRDGNHKFEVMGAQDIEKIKQSVIGKMKHPEFSPWVAWESEMWRKCPLKRLLKTVPLSSDVSQAIAYDDQTDAGMPQDLAFDFDSARARAATQTKTEALKEKIDAKKAENKLDSNDLPKMALPEQPQPMKGEDPGPQEAPPETIPAPAELNVDGDEKITKEQANAFVEIAIARKIPMDKIKTALKNAGGYMFVKEIQVKSYPALMDWIKGVDVA